MIFTLILRLEMLSATG